jgi:hypothetical protein
VGWCKCHTLQVIMAEVCLSSNDDMLMVLAKAGRDGSDAAHVPCPMAAGWKNTLCTYKHILSVASVSKRGPAHHDHLGGHLFCHQV